MVKGVVRCAVKGVVKGMVRRMDWIHELKENIVTNRTMRHIHPYSFQFAINLCFQLLI